MLEACRVPVDARVDELRQAGALEDRLGIRTGGDHAAGDAGVARGLEIAP